MVVKKWLEIEGLNIPQRGEERGYIRNIKRLEGEATSKAVTLQTTPGICMRSILVNNNLRENITANWGWGRHPAMMRWTEYMTQLPYMEVSDI